MRPDSAEAATAVPDPAVVVLIGPSGSGKSAWAAANYLPREIVSSDQLRAVVGSGEHDLDASADAFALLDQIVSARAGRRLTTVIDTLGLDPARRQHYLARGQESWAACRRGALRHRRGAVPAAQSGPAAAGARGRARRAAGPPRDVADQLGAEGFDAIVRPAAAAVEPAHSPGSRAAATEQQHRPAQLEFILQISRFSWADDPAAWLTSVALAAAETGLHGIALMDHLIQIPQVGRPFEPIPEPWVTLGFLAALDTRLRLGTLVSPVTFRPPGIVAKTAATLDVLSGGRAFCGIGAGWWDREHAAFGLPFPPPADAPEFAGSRDRDAARSLAAGHQAVSRRTREPAGDHLLSAPGVPDPGDRGRQRRPDAAARRPPGRRLQPAGRCRGAGRAAAGTQTRTASSRAGTRREVAITVLDVPVLGRDREHAAALVGALRGRTSAAVFARRHHAGVAADHIGRYRQLADRGVSTVFIALPDLTGPDDLSRLAPVVSAFA